ncbi:hypothetical protein NP493_6007g00005 [Ridgeia piscesae]|uniref:Reverse transcriptase RNase H-like domain-containing protein n=1 Tax=Ridgeia piscesae TaxID=27915 RepID=A0AAD9ISZ7_RIDPI|nr:hypothetical protein NP493_6007g00005 [Ridgeia piscesae]
MTDHKPLETIICAKPIHAAHTRLQRMLHQIRGYNFDIKYRPGETIKELPTDLRPYWSFRDELAMESGVLFKGRQVSIPRSMQKEILQRFYQCHHGAEKTRRLARESVYCKQRCRTNLQLVRDLPGAPGRTQEGAPDTARTTVTTMAVHCVRSR